MKGSDYQAVRAHLVKDGRVLMALSTRRSIWTTFGGKVEPDETPDGTLYRELQEELGIRPTLYHRLSDRDRAWNGARARIAVFVVTDWDGAAQNLARHEHAAIQWFNADEITSLSMTEEAREELLAFLESRR